MFRYGFELECFWDEGTGITLPRKALPTDGFPGLVEFRTESHHSLEDAFGSLIAEMLKYDLPLSTCLNFSHSHTFTPQEKRELRTRNWSTKHGDIKNIYGRQPRALGNKTIASFQVSISNLTNRGHTDSEGIVHPDLFSLLDVNTIVKSLDEEFSVDIKTSKRQPGEYAIKGDRLEYRSLPNFVWKNYTHAALLKKIKRAVERS